MFAATASGRDSILAIEDKYEAAWLAAAATTASFNQRSFCVFDSALTFAIFSPAVVEVGRSAKARVAASCTCGFASLSMSCVSSCSTESAIGGRTCNAFRRTPADGCLSAAKTTSLAFVSEPSRAPRPWSVQSA